MGNSVFFFSALRASAPRPPQGVTPWLVAWAPPPKRRTARLLIRFYCGGACAFGLSYDSAGSRRHSPAVHIPLPPPQRDSDPIPPPNLTLRGPGTVGESRKIRGGLSDVGNYPRSSLSRTVGVAMSVEGGWSSPPPPDHKQASYKLADELDCPQAAWSDDGEWIPGVLFLFLDWLSLPLLIVYIGLYHSLGASSFSYSFLYLYWTTCIIVFILFYWSYSKGLSTKACV